jgi:hypothetical protein
MYDTAELLEYGGFFRKGTVVSEAGKVSLLSSLMRHRHSHGLHVLRVGGGAGSED